MSAPTSVVSEFKKWQELQRLFEELKKKKKKDREALEKND